MLILSWHSTVAEQLASTLSCQEYVSVLVSVYKLFLWLICAAS